ncbi:MAG TPA: MlaD family protein [Bacteroidia bacterium]|jgi:phospholipid/cholesterol/gamma-HCH transport system substrate-binding protein|nr:MlaD family protein [Bacteroidia bacterium]
MKLSKEVKTGLVTLVAIAVVIWGFNFLNGNDIFKKSKYIYAIYDKTDGLIDASPVYVSGVKVGQVNKSTLIKRDNKYKVLVTFILTEDIKIPKDSKAKLISVDLLGSKAIDLQFSTSTVYINTGDTILADYEDDLKTAVDKRIAPLQKKAESLISSIDSVMQVVQEVLNANVRQNLVASFESIKTTLFSLQHAASGIDTLVSTQKSKVSMILGKVESLAANLEKNNDKITNILNNFSNISDSLAKSNIKTTIEHANLAVAQVNNLLEGINSGKGTLGKLVKNDSIYNNLNRASNDLDLLLVDLREHPKRYVSISVFGGKDKKSKTKK